MADWFDEVGVGGNAAGAGGAGGAGGLQSWINQQLQTAQSTDDPNAWVKYMSADPKAMAGDPSALAYWQDRIARGDGAAAVKNGTLQKYGSPGLTQQPPTQQPPSQPMNFDQALAKIQQSTGKTLSESEINGLFQKFGGDRSSTFTDQSLAPVISSLQAGPSDGRVDVQGAGPTAPPNSLAGATQQPLNATPITPQNVNAPERLNVRQIVQPDAVNAQQINAAQSAGADRITAQSINGPDKLSLGSIGAPTAVNAQTIQSNLVQGPEALTATNAQNPTAFQGVSKADLEADPGYQYRLKQTQQALEQSAAAKGIARGSNTWNALMANAGEMAAQQYQQTYQNKLGEYQSGITNNLNTIGQNNAANAQAYGLTNQYQQGAALANQSNQFNTQAQNAQNALNAGQFNQQQNYNTQAQNIQNQLAGYQAYQGLNQNAQQFNAGQNMTAQQQNAANQLNNNQFNAGLNQQAQTTNAANNLSAGQFNAGMNFNTQSQNAGNQIAGYNAYAPLAQQAQQFNSQQGFNAQQANNTNQLNAYNANVQNQLGQGNLALGYQNSANQYNLGQGNLALGYQQAANQYALGQGNLGLGYANFGLNQQGQNYNQALNTFNTNQGVGQQNWQNQYNLAQLGLQANGQLGQFGSNYATNAGNLYTGIGNAQGAGQIAGGNAWNTALGALGNGITQGAYMNLLRPKGQGNASDLAMDSVANVGAPTMARPLGLNQPSPQMNR